MIYVKIYNNGTGETRYKKICTAIHVYKEPQTAQNIISLNMEYYDRRFKKVCDEVNYYDIDQETLYVTTYHKY